MLLPHILTGTSQHEFRLDEVRQARLLVTRLNRECELERYYRRRCSALSISSDMVAASESRFGALLVRGIEWDQVIVRFGPFFLTGLSNSLRLRLY